MTIYPISLALIWLFENMTLILYLWFQSLKHTGETIEFSSTKHCDVKSHLRFNGGLEYLLDANIGNVLICLLVFSIFDQSMIAHCTATKYQLFLNLSYILTPLALFKFIWCKKKKTNILVIWMLWVILSKLETVASDAFALFLCKI